MKIRRLMRLLLAIAGLAVPPVLAKAQALVDSPDSSGTIASTPSAQPDLTYTRPTEKTKIQNYLFDAFGPYPAIGAAFAAGIGQAYDTPPEWKQGAEGYTQAIWIGLRNRSDQHVDAIWTSGSVEGRYVVLPL